MTNPRPRPALRKAEDADVHPAAPQPARSPRAARPATEIAVELAAEVAAAAPAADVVDVPAEAPAAVAPKPPKGRTRVRAHAVPPRHKPKVDKRARADFAGTTSDHLRRTDAPGAPSGAEAAKRRTAEADLMTGPTTELDVQVPKKLRKAAKKEAARRGLDLDAVVTDLLHAWLHR